MDMRKYSTGLITPEHLHDGPLVETIVDIYEHETHGCAVLVFESGNQFYCWNNYTRILNKAWGYDSEDWLQQQLELSLDHYDDRKSGKQKETVAMRPISPPKAGNQNSATPPSEPPLPATRIAAPKNPDIDDDIPF
ncbi:hypothetical protein [Bradyrhizobium sp. McL0616]|uniref:hypothetical protein n=1 Tax=Bradyrhizobium sp. McL0616 TaxID=3415674 RepID=UPI003CF8D5F1